LLRCRKSCREGRPWWLKGYSAEGFRQQIKKENDFETFFAQAPAMDVNCSLKTR
jgi:hypothetical protein